MGFNSITYSKKIGFNSSKPGTELMIDVLAKRCSVKMTNKQEYL